MEKPAPRSRIYKRWPRGKLGRRGISNLLAVTAWIAFLISIFLPVADMGDLEDEVFGWFAAFFAAYVAVFPFEGFKEFAEYLVWAGWTVSNLLMILSPFALWRYRKRGNPVFFFLYGGAVLSVLQALSLIGDGITLLIGWYLWTASFALILAALIVSPKGAIKPVPLPPVK